MRMSILSVESLTHSFGPSPALRDINLAIRSGEVVGIVGENGAGKSTLLNVLSGTLKPSKGTVAIGGTPVALENYFEANQRGIWRIFQDPALIGALPVYESLFLGHEKRFTRFGVLNKAKMVGIARDLVRSMGIAVDVKDLMLNYDFATRQSLEVCRAILLPKVLGLPSGFVLFDEPTTGLSRAEVVRLLGSMGRLRRQGAGVAFVSHRLQEVFDVCDRLIVLKDGAIVGEGPISQFDEAGLHRLMVGRAFESATPGKRSTLNEEPFLIVKGLSRSSRPSAGQRLTHLTDISFNVGKGEIVGIGGLLGSGKGQLLRVLAGVTSHRDGTVELGGMPLAGSIAQRKQKGIAFIPGDRSNEAVIVTADVASNISLPSGHAGARGFSNAFGIWRSAREQNVARQMIASLRIKAVSGQPLRTLSGGNQQKVSLARWIHREPVLLLIENPTAGVDVGAKSEIYALLRDLTADGTSILYVTDDLPELISLSDRIMIMRDGRIVSDIDTRQTLTTEHALVADMIGPASNEKTPIVAP
ncbi:sugar ABC transporter ATP-binding protein [Agrobacterium vitis]|uniref:Sugar ABC transporter ATP-binding protein n=2 Tax=Agrobacterium vitis TaxID=373 RepID=A0A7J4WZN9_AGRVI|nr:sugar ABC transporter ATP-binding protein [Agrobacterium vitis]MUZ98284.1 ATP-binding cassette domain-containing protein [Agrobacterium vitis]NSZ50688.1 sugar ABC transporter ATP-binding protein [Agrobacterium vitis]UJL76013.1 sugar ABC transporter ATP-binding protein [Agrobacterium vitis]